ncbi:RHS repeat-associated core domain-containing protein [Vibrio campbellii]|uniref:RHS repeat-associated core domain-containing protein n=1 Tax=Vibrio sp. LB10LO1 TaxID=2711207 RepID=UPI0013898E75|nr:RHS repeat-associated core domain-containing protein [Vibrio sp. LB10LO1]NDJ84119.1 RHS repeat-associated core domain-containing protein [Vibrio sp. LB10LO1]
MYTESNNYEKTSIAHISDNNGIVSLSIPVTSLVTHQLKGLNIDLSLNYSPFSSVEYGLGTGWQFALTTLVIGDGSRVLTLSDGNTVQLDDYLNIINCYPLTVQINNGDYGSINVYYKDGTKEVLNDIGSNGVYRLTERKNPTGETIYFNYNGGKLTKIKDDNSNDIITITYFYDYADLYINPLDKHVNISFSEIEFSISMPYSTGSYKQGEYIAKYNREYSGYTLIDELTHPNGTHESFLINEDFGAWLTLPDGTSVPTIKTHVMMISDQQTISTEYEFDQNHNAYGLGVNSPSSSQDNLYHINQDYTYWSSKTINDSVSGSSRNIRTTFNKLHLPDTIESKFNGSNKLIVQQFEYEWNPLLSVAEQESKTARLPISQTAIFKQGEEELRRVGIKRSYDEFSNILTEYQFTQGALENEPQTTPITQSVYYPATGETGLCPAHPYGFASFLKEKRVTPPTTANGEKEKVERYTHIRLGNDNNWRIVPDQTEVLVADDASIETLLYSLTTEYNDDLNASLLFALPKQQSLLKSGKTTTKHLSYDCTADGLCVTEELVGHDALSNKKNTYYAEYTQQVVKEVTPEGVTNSYVYDDLGRVVTKINAQGSEYEQVLTIQYAYNDDSPGDVVTQFNHEGVQTKDHYDGLGQLLSKENQDDDGQLDSNGTYTGSFREVERHSYDAFGRQLSEASYDYYQGQPLSERSVSYNYDDWGFLLTSTYNDGRIEKKVIDPAALSITRSLYSDSLAASSIERVFFNVFRQPERLEKHTLKDGTETLYSQLSIEFDGFGRQVSITTPLGRTAQLEFDDLDRPTTLQYFGNTSFQASYADFSVDKLLESISFTEQPIPIASQSFDGLGRISSRTIGQRLYSYEYQVDTFQPTRVVTPSQNTLTCDFIAALNSPSAINGYKGLDSSDPSKVELSSVFTFGNTETPEQQIGLLYHASNQHLDIDYVYTPTRKLSQTVSKSKIDHSETTKAFSVSLGGLPVTKAISEDGVTLTDILYEYDEYGRLFKTVQSGVSSETHYDALGRVLQNVTINKEGYQQQMDLEFDELSREIKRTITVTDPAQQEIATHSIAVSYDIENKLLSRTTSTPIGVLEESFAYDERNRLTNYTANSDDQELLPNNALGMAIEQQTFQHGQYNNLEKVTTLFTGGESNETNYSYENTDNTQVSKVTHSHPAIQPQTQTFSYDNDGNMVDDGAGNRYSYSVSGRMRSINEQEIEYLYNPFEQIYTTKVNTVTQGIRHYLGKRLAMEATATENSIFVAHNGMPVAEVYDSHSLLLSVNKQNSVVVVVNSENSNLTYQAYTPNGETPAPVSRTGFNGEIREHDNGLYQLGNGTRAYCPVSGVFLTPDSWSPFNGGGLNPYTYCSGDPVNMSDPSGHFSSGVDLGLNIFSFIVDAIAIVLAFPTGGASMTLAAGIAITASTLGATSAVLGIAADSIAISDANHGTDRNRTSDILGKTSAAFGLASMVVGGFEYTGKQVDNIRAARRGTRKSNYDLVNKMDDYQLKRVSQEELLEFDRNILKKKSEFFNTKIEAKNKLQNPKKQALNIGSGLIGLDTNNFSSVYSKGYDLVKMEKTKGISSSAFGWNALGAASIVSAGGGYALFANTNWGAVPGNEAEQPDDPAFLLIDKFAFISNDIA